MSPWEIYRQVTVRIDDEGEPYFVVVPVVDEITLNIKITGGEDDE